MDLDGGTGELAASMEPVFREFVVAVPWNTRAGCERLGLHLTDVQPLDLLAALGPVPVVKLGEPGAGCSPIAGRRRRDPLAGGAIRRR